MMKNLHTSFISKELIIPSSPTPHHLKTYNLSFSDNFCPSVFIPLVFFYPYSDSTTPITKHQKKSTKLLKKSLSQTLTYFYPFSGRLVDAKDGSYVDCNDEGVEFVVARVNAQLSEVKDAHYQTRDNPFFPTGSVWERPSMYGGLVKVKLTYFECGGLALSVCLSHKIGDTCSLCTFIKHWATVSHNLHCGPMLDTKQQQVAIPPRLIMSQKCAWPEVKFYNPNKCISKRFVFPNVKIQQLKAAIVKAKSSSKITNPTRVEVVNSLLYRCAVKAARSKLTNFFKLFVLAQTVNMRKRLDCPLQETTVGNYSWCLQVPAVLDNQLTLISLIAGIQDAKRKLDGMTMSKMNLWQMLASYADKYMLTMPYDYYICTSLCGYQLYEVEFGWGKPVRVTFPCPGNFFILMDTPNKDGIEVVVSLEEDIMPKFLANKELLAFAYAS